VRKQPIWIRVVRSPFLAIDFVVRTIYAGLFGWWLDDLLTKKSEKRLADDVRHNLPSYSQKNGPNRSERGPITFNKSQSPHKTSGFGLREYSVSSAWRLRQLKFPTGGRIYRVRSKTRRCSKALR
jgi:hypothetical protein